MARVKSTKNTVKGKPGWPQIAIRPENREALVAIGDEWRMNLQETIAALVERWNASSDEEKVNAIRRPVRETVTA